MCLHVGSRKPLQNPNTQGLVWDTLKEQLACYSFMRNQKYFYTQCFPSCHIFVAPTPTLTATFSFKWLICMVWLGPSSQTEMTHMCFSVWSREMRSDHQWSQETHLGRIQVWTDVLRAVHLWLDLSTWMSMPSLNWAFMLCYARLG